MYKDAFKRLREGKPGFAICTSVWMAMYQIDQPPCDIIMVGKFLKSVPGWILPHGSDLMNDIDKAIETLKEKGEITKIHEKWISGVCVSGSARHDVAFGTIVFGLVLSMTTL